MHCIIHYDDMKYEIIKSQRGTLNELGLHLEDKTGLRFRQADGVQKKTKNMICSIISV